jgi:hypothetical protein
MSICVYIIPDTSAAHKVTVCLQPISVLSTGQRGASGSVVGWGTMLQVGTSRVQVPMRSFGFFNYNLYLLVSPPNKLSYSPGVDHVFFPPAKMTDIKLKSFVTISATGSLVSWKWKIISQVTYWHDSTYLQVKWRKNLDLLRCNKG